MRAAWLVLAACGHPARGPVDVSTTAPAAYPGVLRDPAQLPHDFFVRQTLTVHAKSPEGTPVSAELDTVVQKQGGELLILGFGPMNVKAFKISQQAGIIHFEQYAGPPLAFSPRDIVLDVHRVFFDRLPAPAAGFEGVHHGELDGELVDETWTAGNLRAVVFTRTGKRGAVRIVLGPGCGPVYCEPETAELTNEWFDYSLKIVNEPFERL
ncbi:hypothetical protein BH11MYX1_BH11MYX1_53530 [soil metagenome]